MVSIFESSYFPKSKNSGKNCSSPAFTAEICFIRFIPLVDNPRIGTDSELTTINETSNDISYALE